MARDCHVPENHTARGRKPEMTSPDPTTETEEVLSTPATPGAQALPATEDDDATHE